MRINDLVESGPTDSKIDSSKSTAKTHWTVFTKLVEIFSSGRHELQVEPQPKINEVLERQIENVEMYRKHYFVVGKRRLLAFACYHFCEI